MIWKLEPLGVEKMKHYLTNLVELLNWQTIYIMPKIVTEPRSWDEIKNGHFQIINGQHDIFASKALQNEPIVVSRKESLRTWWAFVV